jgi:hypothetical protein
MEFNYSDPMEDNDLKTLDNKDKLEKKLTTLKNQRSQRNLQAKYQKSRT